MVIGDRPARALDASASRLSIRVSASTRSRRSPTTACLQAGAGAAGGSASPRGWRWTYLVPNGANFVDLHVYIGGAAALEPSGHAVQLRLRRPDAGLPAAVHLSAVRRGGVLPAAPAAVRAGRACAGSSASIAALYGVVRVSQRLLGVAAATAARCCGPRSRIWIEPLRSTFDYGQINVMLVLAVLWAVYSSRWWLSGLLVGLAAGSS